MTNQRVIDAFVEFYEQSLKAQDIPTLTEDQREALRGLLAALAADAPSKNDEWLRRLRQGPGPALVD